MPVRRDAVRTASGRRSGLALAACWYWIRKLQARFFAGDYASAVAAAANAERLLWTSPSFFELAEYHFYAALARAALCDAASGGGTGRAIWRHWPPTTVSSRSGPRTVRRTLQNRAALVGAEIARLEGRELDAERFTNRPSARPARTASSTTRRSPTSSPRASTRRAASRRLRIVYLRNARYGYLRWGADGKVRQLDQHIRSSGRAAAGSTSDEHDRGRRSNTWTSRP